MLKYLRRILQMRGSAGLYTGGGGGVLGYSLGGYVPPGTPNWHPF